jgi:hypothetical protein
LPKERIPADLQKKLAFCVESHLHRLPEEPKLPTEALEGRGFEPRLASFL